MESECYNRARLFVFVCDVSKFVLRSRILANLEVRTHASGIFFLGREYLNKDYLTQAGSSYLGGIILL